MTSLVSSMSLYLGDLNLDGKVDVPNDVLAVIAKLGTTGGATWANGDFNGDGNVDVAGDMLTLISRLEQSVVPTPPAALTFSPPAATSPLVSSAFTANLAPPQSVPVAVVPAEVVSFQRDDESTEDLNLLEPRFEIETHSLELKVNVPVEADDRVLVNQTTNSPVPPVGATFAYDSTRFRTTINPSALTTPPVAGYYATSIFADSVTHRDNGHGLLRDDSDEFYVALAGDMNLDGSVDAASDAVALAENLETTEQRPLGSQ